jgi:hypothetical protein
MDIHLISDIILASIGLLVVFFLGHWFTGVNNAQKKHGEALQDHKIKHILSEKENERQDMELLEAKKAGRKAKEKYYVAADDLAKSLKSLADSQKGDHILIKENLTLIKQNQHKIDNIEESQIFIVKELLKK